MTLIVVLGMHRSGTSCVTRMLGAAGVYLGSEVLDAPASDNLFGHWESATAMRINDALLAANGGSWLDVPRELKPTVETRQGMREFLTELVAHPVAGWKDPRTTLTWPVWEQEIGERPAVLVACLRHPLAVARSLAVREQWSMDQGVSLWTTYNQHLERLAETRPLIWLDFDAQPHVWGERIETLCREHGLDGPAARAAGFHSALRHHVPSDDETMPRETAALYERLRQRAGQTQEKIANNSPALSASSPRADATAESVRQAEHRVLQALDARLRQVEQKLGPSSAENVTAVPVLNVLTQVRTSVGVQHQELTSVTNWVTEQQQRLGGTLFGLEAMQQETRQRLQTLEQQQEQLYALLCKLNTALERNEDWSLYVNARCDQAAHAIMDDQRRLTALEQWWPLRVWRRASNYLSPLRQRLRAFRRRGAPAPPVLAIPAENAASATDPSGGEVTSDAQNKSQAA